jgi:subtilase family serine protease
MNRSLSTRKAGRIRYYHRFRLCGFEPLEPRQVFSASVFVDLSGLQRATTFAPILSGGTANPAGFTPAQMRQAYGIDNITFFGGIKGDGKGMTIAIVDEGHVPTVVSDANAFSSRFGLPLFNVAGGPILKVVNQNGSTVPSTMPATDQPASVETSLDVQWAHAIAPAANILLVEVNDPFAEINEELGTGFVDPTQMELGNLYAKSVPGVVVVSNSWGGQESSMTEGAADSLFTTPSNHAGVSFVFSAGDSGGPASYPSASPNVLSVGGTMLSLTKAGAYSSETVWNLNGGAGGGGQSGLLVETNPVSQTFTTIPIEPVPNYQAGLGLTSRGTPDVSMDSVNFPVFDSFAFGSATPWVEVGGTSGSAPMWAALIAIADQGRARMGKTSLANVQSVIYKLPAADFHDITTGNNDLAGLGFGISGNPAHVGYDLASGRGTPKADLVVRDLVAFNGSTLLAPIAHPNSATSSGIWYFYGTKQSTLFTSLNSSISDSASSSIVSSTSSGPSAVADNDNVVSSTKDSDSSAIADVVAESTRTSTIQESVFDRRDDNLSRSHRATGVHLADADNSEVALDSFFAQM